MIARIILLLSLICAIPIANGQMSHGFEIGANMMNGDLNIENENIDTNKAWGPRVGYRGEYFFKEKLYAGVGGLYMQKGFQLAEEVWAVNSFDIPLNMGYLININGYKLQFFLEAGLSLEYNFRAITKINDNTVELVIGKDEGELKSITTGFSIGTGLRLNQLLKLRINYYQGLSNLVNTQGTDSWKNHFIGISLDFFFKKLRT